MYATPAVAEPLDRRVLPHPSLDGPATLAHVLATRRSVRAYDPRELSDAELGQLLWAAQGATDGHRTAPSAGALYPLTLYVADAHGVWRYGSRDHEIIRVQNGDRRKAIARATFSEATVAGAPDVVIIAADVAVTRRRYHARADRFVALEAGHAAQNLLLTATALGLAAVPIGAFDDAALQRAAGIDAAQSPLYVIPVGASVTLP